MTRSFRRWTVVSTIGAATALPSVALAATVTIDTGDSEIAHRVLGSPFAIPQYASRSSPDFVAGSYVLQMGSTFIPFTVAPDGTVSGAANPTVLFQGSTLKVRPTVLVDVDPDDNTMGYRLLSTVLGAGGSGPRDVLLPPGVKTPLCISETCIEVTVQPDGSVSVPAQGAIDAVGSTILFRPGIDVSVDPRGVDMGFRFPNTPVYNVSGPQIVKVVPDVSTPLCIGDTCHSFHVGADGVLTGPVNESVTFGDRAIVFHDPVPVVYDPRGAQLGYRILSTSVYNVSGVRTGTLVPGAWTSLCIATSCFPIRARASGALEGIANAALSFAGNTAFFSAVPVHVEPGDPLQSYRVDQTIIGGAGPRDAILVAGVTMNLCLSPGSTCTPLPITDPCDQTLVVGGKSFHVTCGDTFVDGDGDGVADEEDRCPGGDDAVDVDGDGTPDACDACPVDVHNDGDGDGACDGDDTCPRDAANDADEDGICGDVDACPHDAANDADADGICGDVDGCPLDPHNDADGDGSCGDVDTCAAGDDHADADGDLAADACDVCPLDPANDADQDGACAEADPCPLDPEDDADGDGVCADLDLCPLDPLDDTDDDGLCADVDPCPVDAANDADGDGICESDDVCPTVADGSQTDADGDGTGDACEPDDDGDGFIDDVDVCPFHPDPTQADGDGDGTGDACDVDDDGDGVADDRDRCALTAAEAPVLSDGCSIAQVCPCAAPWKTHGAYVSCVAAGASTLLQTGIISVEERDAVQEEAAEARCGKKR